MSDFYQNGIIATLQDLKIRSLVELESDLRDNKTSNIALLLPSLYSEFERPAMHRIINELKEADYIDLIVLSLDKANEEEFLKTKEYMSVLPQKVRIVWNHGPGIQSLYKDLLHENFPVNVPGKGRVVWMALGYILAQNEKYAIALHDCDIINYSRNMVARLVYPLAHHGFNFEFAKGYYARVTDRLFGRVTRLFYLPLIKALRQILDDENQFLNYMHSFRYPLSGEFAITSDLVKSIRISPSWGLEIGLLSEIYQNVSTNRVCEVELADNYEHKHSNLSSDNPNEGLVRMACDIAKCLYRVLAQNGIILSAAFFRTLYSTYMQQGRQAVDSYSALASINGLKFDRHQEIKSLEIFSNALLIARDEYIKNPVGLRFISAWSRVESALPSFDDIILDYVEEDNK